MTADTVGEQLEHSTENIRRNTRSYPQGTSPALARSETLRNDAGTGTQDVHGKNGWQQRSTQQEGRQFPSRQELE